jgi:hypothetical protein
MALTKKGFSGKVPSELTEARQRFQPDDMFGPNEGAADLMKGIVGAESMNSPASKGLDSGAPGESGPRRAGTAQPVPAGNDASTGQNSPFAKGADGQPVTSTPSGNGATQAKLGVPPYATSTGAGSGKKIVKNYGPGGGATGVGGIK